MAERAPKLDRYRRKRDFSRTSEPAGGASGSRAGEQPEFVVQKHAASHLHYDLRLEVGGVMKSWAVPKGPSVDPKTKRLAMEVEDHPIEYNDFEGTIPQGEYGGGTVMIWDRGSYEPADPKPGESARAAMERGYRKGHIEVEFHGERLRGVYHLIRKEVAEEGRAAWLLIKSADRHSGGRELTEAYTTSVVTSRTMSEIAEGKGGKRVWRSNRGAKQTPPPPAPTPARNDTPRPADFSAFSPMLAGVPRTLPEGPEWRYEPKYDGIRVLAYATPRGTALVTRNGNDKAAAFPEVAEALAAFARERGAPLVLDGELVGVRSGEVVRFESLQGRMHLTDAAKIARLARSEPAALAVFDLLLDGDDVLVRDAWHERRRRLEAVMEGAEGDHLLLSETSEDAEEMRARALEHGWEGIMAKRYEAPYTPGKRTSDWLKIKLENRQELVIGGWTEPRRSRTHLGSLLLGYYDETGAFRYAGHTGTGFSRETLAEVGKKLKRLERKTSPFAGPAPKTNEVAHWVSPKLVAEIRFNEWTSDGKLRQPVFLGLRDDKDPRSVVREPVGVRGAGAREKRGGAESGTKERVGSPARTRGSGGRATAAIVKLRAKGGGALALPEGKLELTNLGKEFFPGERITKGDLLEYYARMSPLILPWMLDRPLVLRRYPNGIEGQAFFQQSPDPETPAAVRVETVIFGEKGEEHTRFVGGDLATLLYTVQLGAISFDPWHSRVNRLDYADYTVIDLDPGPGATFRTVVQVAKWVREEMDALKLHGALKTSGSRGLHVYLPLPVETPLEAATLVAQIVATRVAQKHPEQATVERMVKRRPKGTVYVDYLQNILGKSVAGVFAVRARPGATISTPLDWDELTDELELSAFTLRTVPEEAERRAKLWNQAMRRPIELDTLLR